MEIRRYALYIALAVVSYLLLQAWNADYGQPKQSTVATQSSGVSEVPGFDSGSNSATDIPETVPSTSEDTIPGANVVSEPSVATDFVKVTTDVLTVWINSQGGDIVRIELPQYPYSIDTPEIPFVLLENGVARSYIAKSNLLVSGDETFDTKSLSYTTSQAEYELVGSELSVTLSATHNDVKYQKVFTFRKGDYLFDVNFNVNNLSAQDWSGRLYGQIQRDKTKDPSSGGGIGMASALAFAWTTDETRYEKISFDDIEDWKDSSNVQQVGGWVAFLQHYFVSAWIPPQEEKSVFFYRHDASNQLYRGGFSSNSTQLAPGQQGQLSASFYAGPKLQDRLAEVANNLELSVDYGFLWWAAQPLFWVLTTIQSFVVNWGWSIILLTVLVKALFYPLTAASYRSMAKMRKFAPRMTELREMYGDDRQKLSQEMMKLYKKEGMNPMGGCLPILVQMPVFIALYWVLLEAVELRQSPWIFWIEDLSIKDPTFILPILMAGSMYLQMQLSAQSAAMDPMQAKMMKMMPLVFGVMFLWFPSGLVLYWLVNNLLSIAQQWIINKQIERADEPKAAT